MGKSLFVVLHNAAPGEDEAMNTWYDKVHIPEALRAAPRFTAAGRYRFSDVELLPGAKLDGHRYLTIYEVDGATDEELAEAAASLRAVFFAGAAPAIDGARGQATSPEAISPALDLTTIAASFAVCTLERVAKEDLR